MLRSFDAFDRKYRDKNNQVNIINVSVYLNEFRGKHEYTATVKYDTITILIDTDEKIQIQTPHGKIRTFKKRRSFELANKFGDIFGVNGFGVGFNLSCHEDEIEQAIEMCKDKIWQTIAKNKNKVPDWVFEFEGKEPELQSRLKEAN